MYSGQVEAFLSLSLSLFAVGFLSHPVIRKDFVGDGDVVRLPDHGVDVSVKVSGDVEGVEDNVAYERDGAIGAVFH